MSAVIDETGEGLRSIGRVMARWWVLITIGTVFSLSFAVFALVSAEEAFRARADVLVSPTTAALPADSSREAVLNLNDLMLTLAEVAESDAVLDGVRRATGFDGTLDTLRNSVQVSVKNQTLVLEITVTRSDRAEAQAIGSALVEQFAERIEEIAPIASTTEGTALMQAITLREPTTEAVPSNAFRTIVLALVIGIGFSTVVAFVLDRS